MNEESTQKENFVTAENSTSRLRQRVARCLDRAERARTGCLQVSSGGLAVSLHYRDVAEAAEYAAAFLPRQSTWGSIELTLLTGGDFDFGEMVPAPVDQGRVYADAEVLMVWAAGPLPVLTLYEHRTRRGLVWLPRGRAPAWELSRPACPLLNAAVRDSPWTVCHAAAVGLGGQMLMLAGPGGVGKTTAAVACSQAGWDYAGDDFILVQSENGLVEPLYGSARLRADMAERFATLVGSARFTSCEFGETKHELNLQETLPEERLRGGRLTALLLPRRRGAAAVSFIPANRGELFHALFMVTNQGAPGPLRQHAEKLMRLGADCPVYAVDTANDPAAIPAAFSLLLNGSGARAFPVQMGQ